MLQSYRLPKTNSLHLKNFGWETIFLLGQFGPIFRGENLAVSLNGSDFLSLKSSVVH